MQSTGHWWSGEFYGKRVIVVGFWILYNFTIFSEQSNVSGIGEFVKGLQKVYAENWTALGLEYGVLPCHQRLN